MLAALGSLGLTESATFHSARSTFAPGQLVGTVLGIAIAQGIALVGIGLLVIPLVLGHYGSEAVHLGEVYLDRKSVV